MPTARPNGTDIRRNRRMKNVSTAPISQARREARTDSPKRPGLSRIALITPGTVIRQAREKRDVVVRSQRQRSAVRSTSAAGVREMRRRPPRSTAKIVSSAKRPCRTEASWTTVSANGRPARTKMSWAQNWVMAARATDGTADCAGMRALSREARINSLPTTATGSTAFTASPATRMRASVVRGNCGPGGTTSCHATVKKPSGTAWRTKMKAKPHPRSASPPRHLLGPEMGTLEPAEEQEAEDEAHPLERSTPPPRRSSRCRLRADESRLRLFFADGSLPGEPSSRLEAVACAPPDHGVSEERRDPERKIHQIAQGQQPERSCGGPGRAGSGRRRTRPSRGVRRRVMPRTVQEAGYPRSGAGGRDSRAHPA